MKYDTTNMTLSLYRHLSELLRGLGYDVFWHATGETDPQTAGLAEKKGTITLVPEFPANSSTIVRLISGSPDEHQIAVPAFALKVLGGPKKIKRQGLGDPIFERERRFRIDGFALDSAGHRALADSLYDWLEGTDKRLDIWDYSGGSNPTPLEPALVRFAEVDREELYQENEAIRYYIHLIAALRYYE